jgi:tellurite resistance protein
MPAPRRLPLVPAGFFGFVLGLGGLTNAWRTAHRVWGLPASIGEAFAAITMVVWAILTALFLLKWILARDAAIEEARHPVQSGAIALAGVSTMLVAVTVLPWSRTATIVLFVIGLASASAFGVWQTGRYWQGNRPVDATTPIMYLPTVGLGFLSAIGLAALGEPEWGRLGFGLAIFSWIAIESVLLHRLFSAPPMPPRLRPTLGIALAPPTLGALTYLSITEGPPDGFALCLIGYGTLIALVLLRLLPWILEQPFAASYWGFTFGITSLATAPLRMVERGATGPIVTLAPILFWACNLAMLVIIGATIRLVFAGRLLDVPCAEGPGATSPILVRS